MAETTQLWNSSLTAKVINKIKEMGIDPNEVVYKICIADIMEVIADNFGENTLSYPKDKIEELIEKGTKGCETIWWYETIEEALLS